MSIRRIVSIGEKKPDHWKCSNCGHINKIKHKRCVVCLALKPT